MFTDIERDRDRETERAIADRGLSRALRVQGAAIALFLSLAVVASFAVNSVVVHQGYERLAISTPEIQTLNAWQQDVEAFGNRVSSALGVRLSTAVEFAPWLLEASVRHEFQPELLASLVLTESSFRKDVRSFHGAIGPAQVRPEFWSDFCGSDQLWAPDENIYCGAQVLNYYRQRCGAEACALKAYNIGYYGTREQAGRRYVAKVDGHLDAFENLAL